MVDDGSTVTPYVVEMAGLTDGGRVRPLNEDSFVVIQPAAVGGGYLAVAGVFDGVGGRAHGARASSAAAESLTHMVAGSSASRVPGRAPKVELEGLMRRCHERLRREGRRDPALRGMATTATVALVPNAFPLTLWIGHVGDSPAFRLRSGRLHKLTKDDSVVGDLVEEGLVAPEDAVGHPQRHLITQALGSDRGITPHAAAHPVELGDRYLLCTDGLTAMVSEDVIWAILEAESPTRACKHLIRAANDAGGIDNITVVVIWFRPQPPLRGDAC